MVDERNLLNSKQMADFAADGYLRFDELVPAELNEAAYAEMEAGGITTNGGGTVLDEAWSENSAARGYLPST